MEAVIRHDHYPRNLDGRRPSGRHPRLRSIAVGPTATGWEVSPLRTEATSVPRRVDAFRLIAAFFGLTLYLGAPLVALVWLGSAIFQ